MIIKTWSDKDTPWNDIPILPPATDFESKNILKACISAMTELAKVNALMKTLPNETVLVHTLPLQEARRSSEIENIVTTNDELYRAMSSEKIQITPNTKEVLLYREALWIGMYNMRDRPIINTPLFEQICTRVLDVQMDVRKYDVKIQNPTTNEIIYTPPTGYDNIIRLLTNLEHFINDEKDGIEPLVKMAIMHYQFEAIHPFTDGNGRTGRILNILYLMHQELLDVPILYHFLLTYYYYYYCIVWQNLYEIIPFLFK